MTGIAPKPTTRPRETSLWRYLRLFQRDILSAQPGHLYDAWMAEFRTPFFRSYLINDPDLLGQILTSDPLAFPKSDRVGEGLRPLLGQSVFLTNGVQWQAQRRVIDPAFGGGRVGAAVPLIAGAVRDAIARTSQAPAKPRDVEPMTSHLAADVIFRVLFSVPIDDALAIQVYDRFRDYQRAQPLVNLAAFLPLPTWAPRLHRPAVRRAARQIRGAIAQMVDRRAEAIAQGNAADDLATRLMTAQDPETGRGFSRDEMIDQVAIFFLAGHETSAAALAWALYLVAGDAGCAAKIRAEAAMLNPENASLSSLSTLSFTRDVFRETLRLYPPVPMMVRTTRQARVFRKRAIPPGAQLVLSPWHLHRHRRLWQDPDVFRPERFAEEETQDAQRRAYMPFSSGARACPGAGLAMAEGVLSLALLVQAFDLKRDPARVPVPVAHLTVRARNGIWLRLTPRDPGAPDHTSGGMPAP